ncbi:Chaperonin-like RbcX [Gossypium australe]|uniref:Chaperonin-like RbcX n=1 Tax=Gossypium australe TaxID=47621 RepID=A0A5B6UNW2_9ROSI|nr:Chaperonin-like RbcX [Gossypium australe]
MVGALSVVDSHTGPCLCSTSMNLKTVGELVSQMKRKQGVGRAGWLELGSSFVDSCHDWRLYSKMIPGGVNKKTSRKASTLVVINELGGQYVAANQPTDGKSFLRILGKENQELAERVMITRLHLYGKWIKKCDHAQIYKEISDENLELMRERLMETVVWPSDDSNTDTIG